MSNDAEAMLGLMNDRLAEIRAAEMLPEELVALVERVLPAQAKARATAHIVLPDPAACASIEAMFAGSPLLLRQAFPWDAGQALDLFHQFLDILSGMDGEAGKAAAALRAAIASGQLDPAQALAALPAGDEAVFQAWRQRLPGSPRALEFLVTSALSPSLAAAAELLAPRLPENLPHQRGQCPLCGSLPYISVLRGKEGQRNAVCSFCAHEYRIRRIACAYCDEGDSAKLKLFQVKEYPGLRVDVCNSCSMYIKCLDYREQDKAVLPALDDMASIALDILAQNEGYKRPVLSAWGF